jgi:hypothetical protein
MRRSLAAFLAAGFLLLSLLAMAGGASGATTIAPTTTCANGVDNTGGLGLICEVNVINTITTGGGTAVVTVRECHGAAGAPAAACTTDTMSLTGPVTAVSQCNDAINGGGGTLRCSVVIRNDFVGASSVSTAVTVNQCVGSGGGITTGCDPFPATTTGAAITQCNGSANGGTLVGLTCTATGTMATSAGVTVNQCNGSANGGGALVICSASITNSVGAAASASASASASVAPSASASVAPSASASVAPSATPSATPTGHLELVGLTAPPTDIQVPSGQDQAEPTASPLLGILLLAGLSLLVGAIGLAGRSRYR